MGFPLRRRIKIMPDTGKHQDAERPEDAPAPPEAKVHWLLVLTLIVAVLYLLSR